MARSLIINGENLTTWRKLRGLTAAQVADRAGIARSTLGALEGGRVASLENTLRVACALGVMDQLVRAVDPYETDIGRMRADEQLPQRVRPPQAQ